MTEGNEEDFRSTNFCRFCEKKVESYKVRGLCH